MSDLQYIGGGVAMSNRRLDEDFPASPAPGTALSPPIVRDERFCRLQKGASYNCDGCTSTGLNYREQLAPGRMTTPVSC
eukprot:6707208-Pyramimonas_sp.AAC.1